MPFFFSSLLWNYGLGMTWLVIPLYAHAQGLSPAEIGTLFSIPVVAQIVINLVGGAYVDRFGGKRVMIASALVMAIAAVQLMFSHGYWQLLAAQFVMVLSRASFWPANWSIAAELPGDRGVQAGRLNAVTSVGHVLGNASAGFVLALGGFDASLLMLAVIGVLSALVGLGTPQTPRKPHEGQSLFANYVPMLRMPLLYYAVVCAYLSALPFSLSISFYPLLLKELGYGEEASGLLVTMRALGGIGAGLIMARFIRTGPASPWPVYAGLAVAVAVGLTPLFSHWSTLGLLLFAVGVGSGLMTVYFQITMAEAVPTEKRGSAMALGGLGWGLSHFSTPLVMGLIAQAWGLVAGFYAIGVLGLVAAVAVALARNWAFAGTRVAA
jgi:DHA1 family multidrug resistance protein-like MFS transporter